MRTDTFLTILTNQLLLIIGMTLHQLMWNRRNKFEVRDLIRTPFKIVNFNHNETFYLHFTQNLIPGKFCTHHIYEKSLVSF